MIKKSNKRSKDAVNMVHGDKRRAVRDWKVEWLKFQEGDGADHFFKALGLRLIEEGLPELGKVFWALSGMTYLNLVVHSMGIDMSAEDVLTSFAVGTPILRRLLQAVYSNPGENYTSNKLLPTQMNERVIRTENSYWTWSQVGFVLGVGFVGATTYLANTSYKDETHAVEPDYFIKSLLETTFYAVGADVGVRVFQKGLGNLLKRTGLFSRCFDNSTEEERTRLELDTADNFERLSNIG